MNNTHSKRQDTVTISLLVLVLSYSGWFYNNEALDNPFYLPILSLLLLVSTLLRPTLKFDFSTTKLQCNKVLKDPVIWTFTIFLVYIFIQYINSGALRVYENETLRMVPLSYKSIPFSLSQVFARRMLIWTFTGLSILIAIRHGLSSFKSLLWIYTGIIVNGLLLAVVGLAQFFTGTDKMLGLYPINDTVFFSTFGYENNGGSFFTLLAALTLGGILYSIFNLTRYKFVTFTFFLLSFSVFIISIFPTFTRFCYLQAILLVLILMLSLFTALVWKVSLRKVTPLLMLLFLFTGAFNQVEKNKAQVSSDFKNITNMNMDLVKREFSVRSWQWDYTIQTWKDYPLYGTGHDNMRYVQAWYGRKNPHHLAMIRSAGKANTHNDFLQYLSEFGVIGMTLLMIPLLLMLSSAFCNKFWLNGLFLGSFFGVGLNLAHSLVDLPYRSAQNTFTTLALLALLSSIPCLVKKEYKSSNPGWFFKTFVILLITSTCLATVYHLVAKTIQVELKKSYILSENEPIEKRISILKLADSIWFSDLYIKKEKASLLYKKWLKTREPELLTEALSSIQFCFFIDTTDKDNAILFSRITEKAGYLWESSNTLKILTTLYPKDRSIKQLIKFYEIRRGKAPITTNKRLLK